MGILPFLFSIPIHYAHGTCCSIHSQASFGREEGEPDCGRLYDRLADRRIHGHLGGIEAGEAKWKKQAAAAQQQVDTVRTAIKLLGGMNSSGKTTAKKKRKKNVMSAATKAKIAKAAKERWAKIRAAKKDK